MAVQDQFGTTAQHAAPAPTALRTVGTQTFPLELSVARYARRFVTEAVGTHPARDDAVLLASEFVTNSVLHAHDAQTVAVVIGVSTDFVRIEVWDEGTTAVPHMRETGDGSEDGRGFQLVNELAWRWGFLREPDRTCCWAEIAAPRASGKEGQW
jgi:anti-sigma regulatory factor (Ser/Thr protein kinase)